MSDNVATIACDVVSRNRENETRDLMAHDPPSDDS